MQVLISVYAIHRASQPYHPSKVSAFFSSPVWQVHFLSNSLGHGHCSHTPRLSDPNSTVWTKGVKERKGEVVWLLVLKGETLRKMTTGFLHNGSKLSSITHTVSLLVVVRRKRQKGSFRITLLLYVYWSEDACITGIFSQNIVSLIAAHWTPVSLDILLATGSISEETQAGAAAQKLDTTWCSSQEASYEVPKLINVTNSARWATAILKDVLKKYAHFLSKVKTNLWKQRLNYVRWADNKAPL